MREGAYDFIIKPFPPDRLIVTVRNALERRQLQTLVAASEIAKDGKFHGLIGASLPMRAVYNVIESAASSRATVFVTGESGTGKELCAAGDPSAQPAPRRAVRRGQLRRDPARADGKRDVRPRQRRVHRRGRQPRRRDQPGEGRHAVSRRDLRDGFERCRSNCCACIQSGEFQKVGGSEIERADVRYVCATNRDPWDEVQAGRFREDLYYRLHVVPCAMPPLRERDDDVLLLARHFLALYAQGGGQGLHRFRR